MPLDLTWQVIPPGGTTAVSAASLGIGELSRSRRSLSPDTVTVTVDGRRVDAEPLFAFGSNVTLLRAGQPWFLGRVTRTPASGTGRAQGQSYTLSGPWWYLEHLTCRQTWKTQGGTVEALSGRMILGQGLDGSAIPTGAVITEALQYAIDAGAPFQIGALPAPETPGGVGLVSGTILPGYTIPFDEVKDVTCAEVLRKMARWHPDAVAWFDYATTPPTLHFQPPSALPAATLTLGTAPLAEIGEITPRPDLQAPAVVIHYEVTSTSNGVASLNLVTDAAPPGATGKEFGSVVLTIPLRGSTSTAVRQRVQTTAIKDTLEADGLVAYLSARFAPLAVAAADPSITADGIDITAITRGLSDPDAQVFDPATGEYAAQDGYDDSLGYELLAGAVTDWMGSQYHIRTQDQRIVFKWREDSGTDGAPNLGAEKQAAIDLVATNAAGQMYTSLTSFNAGDAVPTGLATTYLATLSALQWAGRVTLAEPTAGAGAPAATLGARLNIAGSANPAWATMNALIVGEEVQASTGRTTLTLGPAHHLSPQDLVARLQTTRPGGLGGREGGGARGTGASDARTSGAPAGQNTVPGATKHPKQNGTSITAAAAATLPPLPFAPIQANATGDTQVIIRLNGASSLRADSGDTAPLPIDGLGDTFAIEAGDHVWLQIDTLDGQTVNAASREHGGSPPYNLGADGTDPGLVTFSGSGTDTDPFVWNESFLPVAQVYDSDGSASRGGQVFTCNGTSLEVVSKVNTHLCMVPKFFRGCWAMQGVPEFGGIV